MLTIVYVENRLAPLYNFMTETMMTQDYSNPLVYWSVMGQMMTHFEVVVLILKKVFMFYFKNSSKRCMFS